MNFIFKNWLLVAVLGSVVWCVTPGRGARALPAQEARPALAALVSGETLKLRLLWPSGVTLGEAVMSATAGQNDLHFEMTVEADLPIHNISGSFTSIATREGLCSIQYHRKMNEGPKVSEESIDFDQKAHQARRTLGGQTATLPIPQCARDPLTFLYYYRNQLATGSPADLSTFFLGPERSLEVKPAGTEKVSAGGRERSAGKYLVTYHGPNSARTFDLWFSADGAREPVLIRLPSSLAIFSAELE